MYLMQILMKLELNQVVIIHHFADDLKFLVIHFWENDESALIAPSLGWLVHKYKSIIIKQSELHNLTKYLRNEL